MEKLKIRISFVLILGLLAGSASAVVIGKKFFPFSDYAMFAVHRHDDNWNYYRLLVIDQDGKKQEFDYALSGMIKSHFTRWLEVNAENQDRLAESFKQWSPVIAAAYGTGFHLNVEKVIFTKQEDLVKPLERSELIYEFTSAN